MGLTVRDILDFEFVQETEWNRDKIFEGESLSVAVRIYLLTKFNRW